MFNTQDIWDALYDAHDATDDTANQARVRRESRKAYYELCKRISWLQFRDEIEYDFDEVADGMWMPANLIMIDGIGNEEFEWKKATKNGALKTNIQTRMWYIDEFSITPIASGADITIANGSKTLTGGANITADMLGEYIRFDNQSGVHKLLSTTTIETPYYGDALTGAGTYEVRPVGTWKIKLVAPSGIDDTTPATVYYWKFPAQLYDGTQLMELPTSAMLELATSVKVYGLDRTIEIQDSVKKDLYGSKGRYEGEIARAEAMNPEFVMPTAPENFRGNQSGYGARRNRQSGGYGR